MFRPLVHANSTKHCSSLQLLLILLPFGSSGLTVTAPVSTAVLVEERGPTSPRLFSTASHLRHRRIQCLPNGEVEHVPVSLPSHQWAKQRGALNQVPACSRSRRASLAAPKLFRSNSFHPAGTSMDLNNSFPHRARLFIPLSIPSDTPFYLDNILMPHSSTM